MASRYIYSIEFASTVSLSRMLFGPIASFPTSHLPSRSTDQLRGSEHEGQQLVVIETPNAVRPRGLQPVHRLQVATHLQVRGERKENGRGEVGALQNQRFVEAAEENEECGLMTRAVVHALRIAEGIFEIAAELFALLEMLRAHDPLD